MFLRQGPKICSESFAVRKREKWKEDYLKGTLQKFSKSSLKGTNFDHRKFWLKIQLVVLTEHIFYQNSQSVFCNEFALIKIKQSQQTLFD
jgi:hypothetical protein